MEATAHVRRGFAEKFRAELDRRSIGVRTLARTMVGSDIRRIDTVNRQLRKYLRNDHAPTVATRHAIEDALGIARDTLKPDESDDEESDPPLSSVVVPIRLDLNEVGRFIDYDLLARAIEKRQEQAS